ncbi:hypothetical protein [Streptomyces sp. NPDC085540]|uniref:hypothetical protein n=1 Tax=Streptomyces sp. NPDC085540 TaxID=3365730 RepID=UPI0037D77E94
MIGAQQIAGANAALDLVLAHLTHNTGAIASATAASAVLLEGIAKLHRPQLLKRLNVHGAHLP